MADRPADTDERTVAVDQAAGNQAYKVMGWLLVVNLAIRARWPELTTWRGFPVDVLAVLFAGCATWYWIAWRNQILSRRYLRMLLISVAAGAAVAAAMVRFIG